MKRSISMLCSTLLCVLVACGDDDSSPSDEGPNDSGTRADSSVGMDASSDAQVDSSTPQDSGRTADGSTAGDSGATTDSGVDASTASDSGTQDSGASGESFAVIYAAIIGPKCSNCHNANHRSGLRMNDRADAYTALMKAAASDQNANQGGGSACDDSNLDRVEPGDPSKSLLYLKVSESAPPCGARMPPGGALTTEEITRISNWIVGGAAP